jgi:acyl-coenzyme A thioesterase PaaI-like protein
MSGTTPAQAIQDFYPDDFAHCYGCGWLNPQGLRLKSIWEGEEAVARFTPRPQHIAVPGFVYGGLLASLIDCHAMATASAAAEQAAGRAIGAGPAPRFVTAALRVDFLAPTPLGPELEIRGRPKERGARKMLVEAWIVTGGRITVRGEVVAVPMPQTMARAGS